MRALISVGAAVFAASSVTAQVPRAISADPPRDSVHPARMEVLHIPSGGVNINGVVYIASGPGAHPAFIFFHALPGNEKKLDLSPAGIARRQFDFRGRPRTSWFDPARHVGRVHGRQHGIAFGRHGAEHGRCPNRRGGTLAVRGGSLRASPNATARVDVRRWIGRAQRSARPARACAREYSRHNSASADGSLLVRQAYRAPDCGARLARTTLAAYVRPAPN